MIIEIEMPAHIENILLKAKCFGLSSSMEAVQALISCHNWRKSYNICALSELEKFELAMYRKNILSNLKNNCLFI